MFFAYAAYVMYSDNQIIESSSRRSVQLEQQANIEREITDNIIAEARKKDAMEYAGTYSVREGNL